MSTPKVRKPRIAQGRMCVCGQPAIIFRHGDGVCASCVEKEKKLYKTSKEFCGHYRRRGTYIDPYHHTLGEF